MDNRQNIKELQDLILKGLLDKLKSGTAKGTDYANAIKFLEKYTEFNDAPGKKTLEDFGISAADLPFRGDNA